MKIVLEGIKDYFTSVKYFFKPEFKTKSYNLHFYYSILIGLVLMFGMFWLTPLSTVGILPQCIFGAFIAFGFNYVKEWIWKALYNIEPDFRDIYFGSYGGIVATLLIKTLWLYL